MVWVLGINAAHMIKLKCSSVDVLNKYRRIKRNKGEKKNLRKQMQDN